MEGISGGRIVGAGGVGDAGDRSGAGEVADDRAVFCGAVWGVADCAAVSGAAQWADSDGGNCGFGGVQSAGRYSDEAGAAGGHRYTASDWEDRGGAAVGGDAYQSGVEGVSGGSGE